MLNSVESRIRVAASVLVMIALSAYGESARPSGQQKSDIHWAIQVAERYAFIKTDITYLTAANYDAKLDLYIARGQGPRPTVIYIHGGGWAGQMTKETTPFVFLPFLQLGWNVVNVDYRPSSVSLAPAAVEDCLCALRWVELNASEYDIDVTEIVLMGRSAGGHLALTTGMIPRSTSVLGAQCVNLRNVASTTSGASIRPAAIVNWFGITDVADLIEGENQREYAVAWLGSRSDRRELARLVSPLNYVREGLPPIITIHGDRDQSVPYESAVRFHSALTAAHVKNKLIAMPGAGHGPQGEEAALVAYSEILQFLGSLGMRTNVMEQ